ncbi:hypothetical protein [Flavobacterium sp. SM2513]|uniref:hypothetical protein n=1 Tax=Flavobacterium sp. SM2513 TaxID=3424766 RepID=UPI003D7F2D51
MKNIFIFIFLFSTLFVNAQSDTLVAIKRSVISLDKVKTVYRGIANPISVAVSDCKSFTVEGIGLREESKGKYVLYPGQGNETTVVVKITNSDDSILVEEHTFTIANIPKLLAKINNQNCYNCIVEFSKEELKNAVISIGWNDVKIDLNSKYYEINEFTISISGTERIKVLGNKFSEEAVEAISKLKTGSIFYILHVRYPNPHNAFRMDPNAIKIMIK